MHRESRASSLGAHRSGHNARQPLLPRLRSQPESGNVTIRYYTRFVLVPWSLPHPIFTCFPPRTASKLRPLSVHGPFFFFPPSPVYISQAWPHLTTRSFVCELIIAHLRLVPKPPRSLSLPNLPVAPVTDQPKCLRRRRSVRTNPVSSSCSSYVYIARLDLLQLALPARRAPYLPHHTPPLRCEELSAAHDSFELS